MDKTLSTLTRAQDAAAAALPAEIEHLRDQVEALELRLKEQPTPASHTAPDALREALKLAIMHVKHMASWIGDLQLSGKSSGYSFEALGEDMPGIEAALSTPAPADTKAEAEVLREALERIANNNFSDDFIMSKGQLEEHARAALNQGRQAS